MNKIIDLPTPLRRGACPRCKRDKKRGNKPLAMTHFDLVTKTNVCFRCAVALREFYKLDSLING